MLRECILRTAKRWYSDLCFFIEKNRVRLLWLWLDMKLSFAQSRLLVRTFTKVWGNDVWQNRWLDKGDMVIKVQSWRSALIRTPHGVVKSVTARFWWFK